jgi:hypothetical protein
MSFKQLLDYTKLPQELWIHLTFEKIFDNNQKINFFPIVFQQNKASRSTQILLFDVTKMAMVRQTSILQNVESKQYLVSNPFGFAKFTITRTADIFTEKNVGQNTKYQISCGIQLKEPGFVAHNPFAKQEKEAKCTVELQEFFVRHRTRGTNHIKLIGRKQMFLS